MKTVHKTESFDLKRDIRSRHPSFRSAVVADAQVTAAYRGERSDFRSDLDAIIQIVRLAWTSDAFLAQAIYRAKAAMQRREIPLLPRLAHRASMAIAQIAIGDPVVMHPGVYIAHGQVVIDGVTEIMGGGVIAPFVSIGLQAGNLQGPVIEENVHVGTGSRLLGEFRVGEGAMIGANCVVTKDVPADTIVVGVPARPVGPAPGAGV